MTNKPSRLPTVTAMSQAMKDTGKTSLYGGTVAMQARRADIVRNVRRAVEAVKRGRESVDLADLDAVQERTEKYLEACYDAGFLPLVTGLFSMGYGLSRQYVSRWMHEHPSHATTQYITTVTEAFSDLLATAGLDGSAAPAPMIFALKNVAGWRDRYEFEPVSTGDAEGELDAAAIAARYADDLSSMYDE